MIDMKFFLQNWIEDTFDDYEIDGNPVSGTYGLVWFIKAKER